MGQQPFWDNGAAYRQYGAASAWDSAVLGGIELPGLVLVDLGDGPGRKWDIKTAPGTDGATYTDQGYAAAPVTLSVTLWTPEQWALWQTILPVLLPRQGKGSKKPPSPRTLVHPDANALGITAVLVLNISGAKPGSVQGSRVATIKAQQWIKPKPAALYTPNATLNIPTVAATEGTFGPPAPPALPSSTNRGP